MTRAVYPGSFDPVTLGHMDIIRRASRVVDELVIGVLINRDKNPLFTVEERVEMLQESVKELKNVSVKTFDGRTVDFARANQAQIIIRGCALSPILSMRCRWHRPTASSIPPSIPCSLPPACVMPTSAALL